MKNIRIIIIAFTIGVALKTNAQQQAMFTQYMFNATAINPAINGTHQGLSATALIREQWVGIEGAPSTQTLSIHSPLLDDRIGAGLLFIRDEIGVTRQHSLFGAYSYRVDFGRQTLSLGLQFGFSNFESNGSELTPNNPDNAIRDYNSGLKPNFGTGAYFYDDRFYLGVSAPMLMNHDFLGGEQGEKTDQRRHYFIMGGYVFDLNPSLKLKPNVLVKGVQGAPIGIDLNANLLIEEVIWFGVSYRSFDSIDLLIELQLSPQLRFGYAHDFTTSELEGINGGTHELMVNYVFKKGNKKTITPRYF